MSPVAASPEALNADAQPRMMGSESGGDRRNPTLLEKSFGYATKKLIQIGKTDNCGYERFAIRAFDFRFNQRSSEALWLLFPGIGTDRPSAVRRFVLGRRGIIPKEGMVFVFDGPAAIVGYSPEQCVSATDAVKRAVDKIIADYPRAKIKILCFSAGTHLGFYVANELGRRRRQPIDKLIAISPGESIADGIFSSWVTADLVKALNAKGITQQKYNEVIRSYTQRQNLKWLPSGRDLTIYAGVHDTFIPIDKPGGTHDLVERLRRIGKAPTYIIHSGKDHVTLPLWFAISSWVSDKPV